MSIDWTRFTPWASLAGGIKPLVFVLAMLAGMALFELPEWRPRDGRQKAAWSQAR